VEFIVRALRAQQVEVLRIAAADKTAARRFAREQGCAVLSVRRDWAGWTKRFAGERGFPTLLFAQELLALLGAGLPLVEALAALRDKEPRAEHRRIVAEVLERLREGKSLSQALQGYPDAFPPLFVASVRASERTGDLPDALARFVAYREQLDAVKKKVVSALIYPMLLLGTGTLVLLFLLFYVVPRFSRVYEELSRDLPLFSSLLLNLGQVVDRHGAAFALLVAALGCTLLYVLAREETRLRFQARLERLPLVNERLRAFRLARFYRTVGMLLRGGMPLLTAAEMAQGLLSAPQRAGLETGLRLVREGQSTSAGLQAAGLVTPIALRMLAVGEQAGNMGEMMERAAQFHDDELARWLDRFVRLFEPLLMAAMGLAVGGVIVLMYMPIFELAGAMQ
jgi:general secretion pathway protein F